MNVHQQFVDKMQSVSTFLEVMTADVRMDLLEILTKYVLLKMTKKEMICARIKDVDQMLFAI